MKKLLLASIIMFGICSFASAQSSDIQAKKDARKKVTENKTATAATPALTNAAGVKPQSSATSQTDDVKATTVVNADGTVATVPAAAKTATPDSKTEASKTDADDAKKKEAARADSKKPVSQRLVKGKKANDN
ncbi:MAG: hypothetical protein WBP16_12420 [Ferruginibacter sp.]